MTDRHDDYRDGPLRPVSQVAREAAAREHTKGGNKVREREASRDSTPVDITCHIRRIVIWDGVSMEERPDPKTGQVRKVEKWVFLPRSQVEFTELGSGEKDGKPDTISIPEWLAKDRGLI